MNLASWIILIVVIVVLALAIKATFFNKKSCGGCCDVGDQVDISLHDACSHCADRSNCSGCAACPGSATARNALQPTIKTQ